MKNEAKRQMTKKAIVAVVLVMASLFAMASLVSAGFVEEVFSEVCELMTTSSAGTVHIHTKVTRTCNTHGDYESFTCSQGCTPPGCTECQNG